MKLLPALAFAVAACGPDAKPAPQAKSDPPGVFALSCEGAATVTDTGAGQTVESLPEQVYVIDERTKRVKRALYPLQSFDDLCSAGKSCAVAITTGQISVKSAAAGQDSKSATEFWVDRRSGRATHSMEVTFANGGTHQWEWDMQCAKAPVPRFDKTEYRF